LIPCESFISLFIRSFILKAWIVSPSIEILFSSSSVLFLAEMEKMPKNLGHILRIPIENKVISIEKGVNFFLFFSALSSDDKENFRPNFFRFWFLDLFSIALFSPNFIFKLLNCPKIHFLWEFLLWRYWWRDELEFSNIPWNFKSSLQILYFPFQCTEEPLKNLKF